MRKMFLLLLIISLLLCGCHTPEPEETVPTTLEPTTRSDVTSKNSHYT